MSNNIIEVGTVHGVAVLYTGEISTRERRTDKRAGGGNGALHDGNGPVAGGGPVIWLKRDGHLDRQAGSGAQRGHS